MTNGREIRVFLVPSGSSPLCVPVSQTYLYPRLPLVSLQDEPPSLSPPLQPFPSQSSSDDARTKNLGLGLIRPTRTRGPTAHQQDSHPYKYTRVDASPKKPFQDDLDLLDLLCSCRLKIQPPSSYKSKAACQDAHRLTGQPEFGFHLHSPRPLRRSRTGSSLLYIPRSRRLDGIVKWK